MRTDVRNGMRPSEIWAIVMEIFREGMVDAKGSSSQVRMRKRTRWEGRDSGFSVLCQRKWHFSGLHRSGRPGLLTKEDLSPARSFPASSRAFSSLQTLFTVFPP